MEGLFPLLVEEVELFLLVEVEVVFFQQAFLVEEVFFQQEEALFFQQEEQFFQEL